MYKDMMYHIASLGGEKLIMSLPKRNPYAPWLLKFPRVSVTTEEKIRYDKPEKYGKSSW